MGRTLAFGAVAPGAVLFMFFAWCVRVAGFLHRANIRRRASKTLQGCFPQAEGIIIEMALASLLELVDENTTPCSRSFEKARSVYVQYQFKECVPGNKFVNVAPSSALDNGASRHRDGSDFGL